MIDQHASLSEKFLKKGFWLYLFSFIIAPIGYIVKIIISGELTVSEVGILYGIISLITMISAYNDLGMSISINHFVPEYVTKKRYDKVKSILVYSLIAQMTTGIIIALFFYFGADYIANNYFKSPNAVGVLKIFSFYFLGINIFQITSTFFMAIQDTLYNKLISLYRLLFVLLFTIVFLLLDSSSLINFTYAWIIGLYIGILSSLFLFYKKYYKKYLKNEKIIWSKKLFKSIFKYAIVVFIGAQAATILSQIDMQMIIYLLGTNDAGFYTNYLSIIGIPIIIIGPIFALLFPIFSEMYAKKEYNKIKQIKQIFNNFFIKIGIILNILFFIFAKQIAYILFGEKFITSGIILQYSILLLLFNFLLQINFQVMAGIGKVKDRVKIIFIAIIFNFILNIILIKSIGVSGAALATGFGWLLIWILSEIFLGKKYFIKYDYKSIIKNIIFIGLIGYISYLYIIPIFEGLSRIKSLGLLFIIGILWFSIFTIINIKEVKVFIGEIKKLKKG